MAKLKKGQKLICVPCGREVLINSCGISRTTIWCCGKSMKTNVKSAPRKKTAKK
ncbi:MAG: hypothetical protein NG737_05050 [Omnitrophica bacterium]|nr:hypothetical protein [Candidatus Omnitrophota bacterium]